MMNTNWTLAKDLLIRSLSAKAGNRKDEEEVLINCGLAQLNLANSTSGKENYDGQNVFQDKILSFGWCRFVIGLGLLPDISAKGILAQTSHQGDFLARGYFSKRTYWHGYLLVPWTFQNKDVTALEYFVTRIISTLMPKFVWQNVYTAF